MSTISKKAIIIGASSGIGKELAIVLAQNGYKVGIAARRKSLLKIIKKEYPKQILIKQININETKTSKLRIRELIKELGGLDLFVMSAAVGFRNEELSWELEKNTIETNIEAYTSIVSYIFKYFKKKEKGHIASISSIAGLRGNRHAPAYSASKSYQISYLQSLVHNSVKNKLNISITDIRPGFVDTAMAQGDDLFWVASPKKAAMQIYSAIKRKQKVAYITKRWILFAYFMKWLPGWIFNKL